MSKGLTRGRTARTVQTFAPMVVEQLQHLEQELGGRTVLVAALALAPMTPTLRYTLGLLGDPRYQTTPLAEVCALGNILPGELLQSLMRAALLKGKLLATQAVGDGIAAVARDLMQKAAPHEAACYQCRGVGKMTPEPTTEQPNPGPEDCEICLGTGQLRYEPTLERQKLALELAQLLPKGGGVQILNQQFQAGDATGASGDDGQAGGSLFLKLQQLTDKVLYDTTAKGPEDSEEEEESPVGAILPDADPMPAEGEVLEDEAEDPDLEPPAA